MPIVLGTGFVLSEADEVPGTPWIGWHNVVSASPQNVTATTNVADSVNLANPSTNLKWVGTTATEQYITVTTDPATTGAGDVDYLGVAKHNFGSAGIAVSVEGVTTNPALDGETSLLLHFDGNLTDSSTFGHVFSAQGDAAVDNDPVKFGTGSLQLDGTGDRLIGNGNSAFAFGTGDFTIDFWIRFASVANGPTPYDSRPSGTVGLYPTIYMNSAVVIYHTDSADRITGTTVLTTGVWYHVAVTRSSGSTRLFLNGVQEGSTYVDSNNYLNGASRPVIGAEGHGFTAGSHVNGWIDEVRVVKGTAKWTSTFDPPAIAHPWAQLTSPSVPADDSPLMFRWDPAIYYTVRLRMQAGSEAPQAAVVYIGELLVCERSIDVNVEHVPVTYGRRTHAVNGMSQSGEFLGRIVIGEHRETKAEFKWFQDTWWRANFDPFLQAAQEIPFFWAGSPEEYPAECGYVWLTNDAEASVDPVTRRVHTELVMEGVA